MNRSLFPLFALCAFLLHGCATTGSGQRADASFLAAARAANAPVRAEAILTDGAITIAPTAALPDIPATALKSGVDIAFARLSAARQDLPAGDYRLRAFADVAATGNHPARIEFVGSDGGIAVTRQGVAQVHSLTILRRAAVARTFVTVSSGSGTEAGKMLVVCCPDNGFCVEVPDKR